jgi:uncharacterized protein YdcH (DUF465 family)
MTMNVSRTELEARHRTLDLRIKKLDRRGMHMTPHEQLQTTELKKLRLATKDKLFSSKKA